MSELNKLSRNNRENLIAEFAVKLEESRNWLYLVNKPKKTIQSLLELAMLSREMDNGLTYTVEKVRNYVINEYATKSAINNDDGEKIAGIYAELNDKFHEVINLCPENEQEIYNSMINKIDVNTETLIKGQGGIIELLNKNSQKSSAATESIISEIQNLDVNGVKNEILGVLEEYSQKNAEANNFILSELKKVDIKESQDKIISLISTYSRWNNNLSNSILSELKSLDAKKDKDKIIELISNYSQKNAKMNNSVINGLKSLDVKVDNLESVLKRDVIPAVKKQNPIAQPKPVVVKQSVKRVQKIKEAPLSAGGPVKIEQIQPRKLTPEEINKKAEHYYKLGVDSQNQEDFGAALSYFNKSLSLSHNFEDAIVQRGKIEKFLENCAFLDEAVKNLNKNHILESIDAIKKFEEYSGLLEEILIYKSNPIVRRDYDALMELNELLSAVPEIVNEISQSYLSKAYFLTIGNNHVTNLQIRKYELRSIPKPVSELINLQSLDLRYNRVVDVSGLSSLKGLQSLDLEYNRVVDVSGLSSLANLKELYLGGNSISDVSGLSSLVNLEKLDLWGNSVSKYNKYVKELKKRGVNVDV